MAFSVFDPKVSPLTSLVQALLASNAGISVIDGSISLHLSGQGAVSLYDSAVGTPLGIGAGVVISSGITPGLSNTSTWYGADNSGSSGFSNGDADIDAVVNTVFQTQSYDATTLRFDFTVSDPLATSISFDLVFGSDEYPEWVDAFVDCGVVIVDGVNYALFNNDPAHPLSVISPNLAAGYFQDNGANTIPIEYDGVSGRLRIVAPLKAGQSTHTIKIGIADTGDHILDSGLFLANMSAGQDPGSGVVANPGGGTNGDDTCNGSSKDEYFDLLAGNDTVYAGAGADIIVAGAGNDLVYSGSGNDDLKGDAGDDLLDGGVDLDTAVYVGSSSAYALSFDAQSGYYSINGISQGEGVDTLLGVEQLRFSDGLFTLANNGSTAQLTAVSPPPPASANSAGLVWLSGLAAVGSTLTATAADADGLPTLAGAIQWQWFRDGVVIAGETGATHKVQMADSNHALWVQATYVDAKGQGEAPSSASVVVQPVAIDGELTATMMAIEGPASASVHTAITTLLVRAVALGETPNSAMQKIRAALNIPAAVTSLLTTNAFKILQTGVGDTTTALALAKREVQVAVLCSVSDDADGLKLTLALLNQAANGGAYDLTDPSDVAAILGLNSSAINFQDKKTWPKTLQEVIDRTSNIQDADQLFLGGSGAGSSIESEWIDFLSNWDGLADDTPLASLSLAINQAPTGFATAALSELVVAEAGAFLLTTAELTQGFQDLDGDPLSVSGLSTDHGDWFWDNGDGTWSLDSSTVDPSYLGPLELSYWVEDGQGHSLAASQMLVVVEGAPAPLPPAPSFALLADSGASASDGLSNNGTVTVNDLISGLVWEFSSDGGTTWSAGGGSSFSLGEGTYTPGCLLVHQINQSGASPDASNSTTITIDQTAPDSPSFALAVDTGASNSDQISSNGLIAVLGLESNGTWELSRDAGATWSAGEGSSFSLLAGSYAPGSLAVRQTDRAGNAGAAASNTAPITIDTALPVVTDQLVGGTSLVLRFAEPVAFASATPTPFTVLNGKTKIDVTAVKVEAGGTSVTLTLASAITSSNLLTIAYTDPSTNNDSSGVIEDLAGNDLASRSATSIRTFLASTSVSMASGFNSGYTGVELTAAAGNASLTGNASINRLTGNAGNNTIKSGAGVDVITGGDGVDTLVYTTLADGILGGNAAARAFEAIRDFTIGIDRFDVTNVPVAGSFKNLGSIATLSDSDLASLLSPSTFLAKGAATFTHGIGTAARTFIAFNDATAGFNAATDAVLEITGYSFASGFNSLSQIGII